MSQQAGLNAPADSPESANSLLRKQVGTLVFYVSCVARGSVNLGPLQHMSHEPCKLCQAQVKLDGHAPPHVGLKLISRGPPYKDMLGADIDWSYQCLDCGAILFHSTDSPDFGWRF